MSAGTIDAVCASIDDQCMKILSPEETTRRFLKELSRNIQKLRSLGKRVIVCLPFPAYDKSIPQLEIRNAVFGRFGLGGNATDFTSQVLRTELLSLALGTHAEVFDPRAALCPLEKCLVADTGVSICIDSQLLAASRGRHPQCGSAKFFNRSCDRYGFGIGRANIFFRVLATAWSRA